ncbi:hypothetical protein BH09BAC2_BH09BAC2_20770 [soil metagenome]
MKQHLILFILFFSISTAQAQFSVRLFAGASNYQGDLQQKKFTFDQAHFGFGLGAGYQFTPHLSARAMATFGKVSADDKNSNSNKERNLNFTSKINEFQLVGEYTFKDMDVSKLSPYLFAGVAVYSFNPYTKDSTGEKFYLQPLSTEGQGFFEDRKTYKLTQISIPFGAGLKLAFTDRLTMGVEFGFRKTFTDYLDDVSTTYIDQNLLMQNRGAKAVELAFRGGELKTGTTYPAGGSQRGSTKKDWYYFTGITAQINLGTGGGSRNGKGVGCPSLKSVF